ncbi:MAG: hypothetical protein VW999_09500 [Alphaproteobacteria bacterium]
MARRNDAVRFLHASLEVLRGAEDCEDDPSFKSTLQWLWDHSNLYIGQLFCSDALKLHALRLPRFENEMKRVTGGKMADDEDILELRDLLIATLESALTEAVGKSGDASVSSLAAHQ